jgi:hypothetical protein
MRSRMLVQAQQGDCREADSDLSGQIFKESLFPGYTPFHYNVTGYCHTDWVAGFCDK